MPRDQRVTDERNFLDRLLYPCCRRGTVKNKGDKFYEFMPAFLKVNGVKGKR